MGAGHDYAALQAGLSDLLAGVRRLESGAGSRAGERRLHERLTRLRGRLTEDFGAMRRLHDDMSWRVARGVGRLACDGALTPVLDDVHWRLAGCAETLADCGVALLAWDTADRTAHARRDMLAAGRLSRSGRLAAAGGLLDGLLRVAPDHPAAWALIGDMLAEGGDARRLALRLGRGRHLGLRRKAVPLPLQPMSLASDGVRTVYVSAFDDQLNSGLYACDMVTGGVRLLRGPDTTYSGLWFDRESGELVALVYRDERRPIFGLDRYDRDGRFLRRRRFGPDGPNLSLPCQLGGGCGRLYLIEYPCGLLLGLDANTMELVDVPERVTAGRVWNLKANERTLLVTQTDEHMVSCLDIPTGGGAGFPGVALPYPFMADIDMDGGGAFVLSLDGLPRDYETHPCWLHRYDANGKRRFSRHLGTARPMDIHFMRESGVLVLAERTAGLVFFDTRGRGGAGRPLPEGGPFWR